MSTILDSLKKSSEQRDGNDKSAIDNFSFGDEKKPTKKSSILIILILLLALIGISYWVYLSFFDGDSYDDAETTTQTSSKETTDPYKQQQTPELLVEKTKKTNPKIQKPNSQDVKNKIREINETQQVQKLSDLNKVQKPEGIRNTDNNNQSEPAAQLELKKKPETAVKGTKKKEPTITEIKQQPKQQRNYLYAYELPFNIRKDLPKLKLNIHVYDEDPKNRIAIINGVKYVIDDMMEEEVLVKDIVPDGVILEFGDNEFLIPKL
jgi:general secretion pathway protein B